MVVGGYQFEKIRAAGAAILEMMLADPAFDLLIANATVALLERPHQLVGHSPFAHQRRDLRVVVPGQQAKVLTEPRALIILAAASLVIATTVAVLFLLH